MTTDFRIATLTRAAAVSLALVIPAVAGFATAAHADDEYGTNRSPTILQSAQSARAADPTQTPLAVATARAQAAGTSVATTSPHAPLAGTHDLVGQGGQQDSVARQTYTPGSGTDW